MPARTDRGLKQFIRPLWAAGQEYRVFSLAALEAEGLGPLSKLPVSIKLLLENVLRNVRADANAMARVSALTIWPAISRKRPEVEFLPGRVLTHDSLGLNMLQDLAALREAVADIGATAERVNPCIPVDLVVDHAVIVDVSGRSDALAENERLEIERNTERYAFLKWAQRSFNNMRIVPPGNGICHQVNLEYLASVVAVENVDDGPPFAVPDTCLGTDSHTPMVNGLGVLAWGVGAIEAEAAMLGQSIRLTVPEVVGIRLAGRPSTGATMTDVVLTLAKKLRSVGVVGRFVEFFGPGISALSAPDRSTIANMAPEFGSTCALFPVDARTTDYLRLTGRHESHIALVESYARAQGLWHDEKSIEPQFDQVVEFDLSSVGPAMAGPLRPHDQVSLADVNDSFRKAFPSISQSSSSAPTRGTKEGIGSGSQVENGHVVIAAITSCTNTSNPELLIAAGLLARNAIDLGLQTKPWVKTSFTPGSKVAADLLNVSGLQAHLDALGFNVVAFGCASCVGNSGPLADSVACEIENRDLVVASVLSGNRNYSGRVHPLTRANYLASPPLVVAYALAGTITCNLAAEPLGDDFSGNPVYLTDIWPTSDQIMKAAGTSLQPSMFREGYASIFEGSSAWRAIPAHCGATFPWDETSIILRRPPYLTGNKLVPPEHKDIFGARLLAILPDMVTTDQIAPAGPIPTASPAGRYLLESGIAPGQFLTYPMRRGNHEIIARSTFAHPRLQNQMVPGHEGGLTRHWPSGQVVEIYDAAMAYKREGVPVIVLAGRDYGAGSSRDAAAKGPWLIGVRAVIAQSFERIHRSNLIGMGIMPLTLPNGMSPSGLGLDGQETFDLLGLNAAITAGSTVDCRVTRPDGSGFNIGLTPRIETSVEAEYMRHHGILPYMLSKLAVEQGITPRR